ncbi:hypothetical protein RV15_GL002032 [Enterococcus silesiacus]|uniref:Uncharacterized protein n=1 Tax=Enterococcus silesiacus TaxID=332949 RepID=A0AA91GJD6_9ENTE|nr:hypothetical protein RV15_GL002032 [Enterococcus silesiacus]
MIRSAYNDNPEKNVLKCEENHNKTIYKKKIMLYDMYVK